MQDQKLMVGLPIFGTVTMMMCDMTLETINELLVHMGVFVCGVQGVCVMRGGAELELIRSCDL